MVDDTSLYQRALSMIDERCPGLVTEITNQSLSKRRKSFTLGSFLETAHKYQKIGKVKYKIVIKKDHPNAGDDDKLSATLLHEYGHFVCRTIIYPHLPIVGEVILNKLSSRTPGVVPKDFTTNLIIVSEELAAWMIGWGFLIKLDSLKVKHIRYGLRCWKSYWKRLKTW